MTLDKNITDALAAYIIDSQQKEFDSEVVHKFKRALMDYVCAAITGSNMPVPNSLLEYLKQIDSSEISSVTGKSMKLSPLNAALVNGTSAHSLDFDDGHTHGSIHIGTVVFPAIFAVAEQYSSSQEEFIKAAIIGYEIAGRLSAALHPNVWKRGYHNTPVIGIFGATAAVCVLLKANKEQILDALGHAGSFSGGLFEFLGEGADIKRIHPGKAARDAILSAELALKGITGPKKVFEGKNGFVRAFADNNINLERLYLGLHTEYEISKIYFKPYPCCRHLHGPIDGTLELLTLNQIDVNNIDRIEVGTYKVGANHKHKEVNHLLDAQMSIPCAVALALVYGEVSINTFEDSKVQSEQVQNLINKVDVTADERCEESYPKHRPAIITITMKDGTEYRQYVEDPKGESNYPLTDKELEAKFVNNCLGILTKDEVDQVLNAIWTFENLENLDVFYINSSLQTK
ncbi:MmgE/PrpD family protein [Neobacillus niacini]|uniref:MmgE/PrpD family protein n=1 Tax=Neobacillus niacini TaxID=86668 RepID=UPI0039839F40